MPLGGFGRLRAVPHEATSTCNIDGGEHTFEASRLSIQRLQPADSPSQAYALYRATVNGTQRAWQWYPASKGALEQEELAQHSGNSALYHSRAAGLSTKECFKPSSSVSSFPRSGLRTTRNQLPGSSL